MEGFLKAVLEDLPVGVDLHRPRVAGGGELGEGVAAEILAELAEEFPQAFLGTWVEVEKDEALPGVCRDRRETEGVFLEVKKILFVWNES